ncbi:hypothetical protein Pyn_35026 [Prunus yedoensis var. nudiflora]|uniref:Uncharacterized protein n=1 Tax=Prunus yedoensis var. nudiflora TaxID=2094558 RepID=A0A314UPV6_PRUYE|nr:hypothetical protein Pyn_35026 [Prunus yedoensis var. nudiflora]
MAGGFRTRRGRSPGYPLKRSSKGSIETGQSPCNPLSKLRYPHTKPQEREGERESERVSRLRFQQVSGFKLGNPTRPCSACDRIRMRKEGRWLRVFT